MKKSYPLCFGSISTEFKTNNTEDKQTKKTGLNEYVHNFSVDYIIIDTSYIIDINKYLMKKAQLKQCLDLLKNRLLDY